MSRNAELMRASYRRVNEAGFAGIADLIDPEFTMDSPQGVDASQAHDKVGLRDWFMKMDEVWEELRFEPDEIIEVDATRLIAVVQTSGRARGSGIEINQQLTHLWTIIDGRATSLVTFNTKREALKAVGLSE